MTAPVNYHIGWPPPARLSAVQRLIETLGFGTLKDRPRLYGSLLEKTRAASPSHEACSSTCHRPLLPLNGARRNAGNDAIDRRGVPDGKRTVEQSRALARGHAGKHKRSVDDTPLVLVLLLPLLQRRGCSRRHGSEAKSVSYESVRVIPGASGASTECAVRTREHACLLVGGMEAGECWSGRSIRAG
jgi:hypothetical protein